LAKSDYEDSTVEELRDELRDRDLPVSGTKDELVARLVEDDKPKPQGQRQQRQIFAGGHAIMVDVDPPTPDPIVTCSICGVPEGECVHADPDHGLTWAVEGD
jgi:SAP domain